MQDATPTQNLAFHRTDAGKVSAILKNGILSMKSQGFDLPNYDVMGYRVARLRLKSNGFKFTIPTADEVKREVESGQRFGFRKRDLRNAQAITSKTFVRVGGVEKVWSPEGVTIAVDMDALKATGVTIWDDSFGAGGDTEIHGDIPASCVVGVVSDEWMREHGFTVDSGE